MGGPLDGRWYFVADLVAMQAAAAAVGHGAGDPAGGALAYEATSGTRLHPVEDVFGAVWRHVASAASRARHQAPIPAGSIAVDLPRPVDSPVRRRYLRAVA